MLWRAGVGGQALQPAATDSSARAEASTLTPCRRRSGEQLLSAPPGPPRPDTTPRLSAAATRCHGPLADAALIGGPVQGDVALRIGLAINLHFIQMQPLPAGQLDSHQRAAAPCNGTTSGFLSAVPRKGVPSWA